MFDLCLVQNDLNYHYGGSKSKMVKITKKVVRSCLLSMSTSHDVLIARPSSLPPFDSNILLILWLWLNAVKRIHTRLVVSNTDQKEEELLILWVRLLNAVKKTFF